MVMTIETKAGKPATAREYPHERVRNIGIIAHIDAGKTTVTERSRFYMSGDRLGANPVAIQLPMGAEANFKGVIDVIARKALFWEQDTPADAVVKEIPAEYAEAAKKAHELLVEKVAETDDTLMHKYLEEHDITTDEIIPGLRAATIANKIMPVLCCAALRSQAVQPLLHAVVAYLPSPLDVPPVTGTDPT